MKKILLFLFVLGYAGAQAQWIDSIYVSPANPIDLDSIYIYADCSFTAGSCDQHTQSHSINGSNISATALHCVGMLTFICPYTDTFSLGTLPAGVYIFTFHLDEGLLPSPCTPGFNPGPTTAFTFSVSTATSVQAQHSIDGMISFYPNPVESKITITNKVREQMPVRIFDMTGNIILEKILTEEKEELYVAELKPGIYFLEHGSRHFKFVKQ